LPGNVDEGVDGWIVEPRDTRAMTQRLRDMLACRDAFPSMGQRARGNARRECCNSRFIRETEGVYGRGTSA
jgi:L-malate glycosyltransferase